MGGGWSDIFYPDNPKRREEVVKLSARLFTLMENNFSAVNELCDVINEHIPQSSPLQHIYVKKNDSIKNNCDVLTDRIEQIQDIVNQVDAELAKKIEPDLYKNLTSPDLTVGDRLQKINSIFTATLSTVGSVAGIVLVVAINAGAFLATAVAAIGTLGTSAIAGFALGILILGADMIAGAIFGAVERSKLEDTIDDLESALKTFEPESKKFQRSVYYVIVSVEDLH